MRGYIQAITTTMVIFVITEVIFIGGPLTFNNLILWAIIGALIGVISKVIDQQFPDPTPRSCVWLDKITDHPITQIIQGVGIGMSAGIAIGGYWESEGGGCLVGGIIGLILVSLWIVKKWWADWSESSDD